MSKTATIEQTQDRTGDAPVVPEPMARKDVFAEVKGFTDAGELEAVASTPALDRQGEVILAEAWRETLPMYRTNPVILAAHSHHLLTGAAPVIGSASRIDATPDGLLFRMRFAQTELGREYEQLYRDGHMRAFSVGYLPVAGEWRDVAGADAGAGAQKQKSYVHTKVDLLEISAVAVPANPEALVRMRELADRALPETVLDDLAEKLAGRIEAGALDKAALEEFADTFFTKLDEAVAEVRQTADGIRVSNAEFIEVICSLLPDGVNGGGSDLIDEAAKTAPSPGPGDPDGGGGSGAKGTESEAVRKARAGLLTAARNE